MKNYLKKYFPLISSLIFFVILIAVLYFISLKSTGGSLYYVLDDPYIHLGLVKNFIVNHVWGHNSLEFSFSSSSPLWTGILFFSEKIFGNNVMIAFYSNILFSVILLTSLIPIILLGFYSKSNGGFFFPNSILLKGNIPDAMLLIVRFISLHKLKY